MSTFVGLEGGSNADLGLFTDGFCRASPACERAVMETVESLRKQGHECVEFAPHDRKPFLLHRRIVRRQRLLPSAAAKALELFAGITSADGCTFPTSPLTSRRAFTDLSAEQTRHSSVPSSLIPSSRHCSSRSPAPRSLLSSERPSSGSSSVLLEMESFRALSPRPGSRAFASSSTGNIRSGLPLFSAHRYVQKLIPPLLLL